MRIREELPSDWNAVHELNAEAFDTKAEMDLVEMLREQASPLVSLVAEENGKIYGHIMFSPVTLDEHPELQLMGLAPMAVAPDRQRTGIGIMLVQAGLEECRKLGIGAVVVLGHPGYYPRFGFKPAVRFDIQSDYDVAEDVFMVLELRDSYLNGKTGVAHYHPAFEKIN